MARFAESLLDAFQRELPTLVGDSLRDVGAITLDSADNADGWSFHEYVGHAPSGIRRFWAAVTCAVPGEIEIFLVVTKGDVEAVETEFGTSGPDRGNSCLVARAFDVALDVARMAGIRRLVCSPIDERVRARYALMGFVDGELLDLDDPACVGASHRFVEHEYAKARQRFPGFRHS
jgi:hypothetical protein